jgi:sulfur-oxidizing protein SoxA
MKTGFVKKLLIAGTLSVLCASALAAEEKLSMSDADKAMYEEMLENNPADVFVAEGEELLKKLGGEAGLAKFLGIEADALPAYIAGFPRTVKKIGMVVALDQMLQAVQAEQGMTPYKLQSPEMDALGAYVKSLANDEPIAIDVHADKEMEAMYALGKATFDTRRGGRGLACVSCHSADIVGSRLRMQILTDQGDPKVKAAGTWPAYRMTKSKMFTLQQRFQQCMKNALLAKIPLGSKDMVALEVYVTDKAKGSTIAVPGLKR